KRSLSNREARSSSPKFQMRPDPISIAATRSGAHRAQCSTAAANPISAVGRGPIIDERARESWFSLLQKGPYALLALGTLPRACPFKLLVLQSASEFIPNAEVQAGLRRTHCLRAVRGNGVRQPDR